MKFGAVPQAELGFTQSAYLTCTTPFLQIKKEKKKKKKPSTQAQQSKLALPLSKLIQLFKCQLWLPRSGSLGQIKLLKIKTVLLRLVFLPF